jgi:hypothetical protein
VVSGVSGRALQPALDRHHYVDAVSFERESEMLRREWTCIGRLDELGLAKSGRVLPQRRAVVDAARQRLQLQRHRFRELRTRRELRCAGSDGSDAP